MVVVLSSGPRQASSEGPHPVFEALGEGGPANISVVLVHTFDVGYSEHRTSIQHGVSLIDFLL